uniref:Uncharacterized protein n=1 Tax=Caenorhabditis japonica TaxID=281687 RepID=A0A8R1ILS5_CAEJA
MTSIFETEILAGVSVALVKICFQLFTFATVMIYFTLGCGVCDTNSGEQLDADGCENVLDNSMSRDSSGFDINPAMSPVYRRDELDSVSDFDWNVLGEAKQISSWWNEQIFGIGGGGGASTSGSEL